MQGDYKAATTCMSYAYKPTRPEGAHLAAPRLPVQPPPAPAPAPSRAAMAFRPPAPGSEAAAALAFFRARSWRLAAVFFVRRQRPDFLEEEAMGLGRTDPRRIASATAQARDSTA